MSFATFVDESVGAERNDEPPKKRRRTTQSSTKSNATSKRSIKETNDAKCKPKSKLKPKDSKYKGKSKNKKNKRKDDVESKCEKKKKVQGKKSSKDLKRSEKNEEKEKEKEKEQNKTKTEKNKVKSKKSRSSKKDKDVLKTKSDSKSKSKDKNKDKNTNKSSEKSKENNSDDHVTQKEPTRKRVHLYQPLNKYTVPELKQELKTLGLSTKGKKEELLHRFFDCVRLLPYEIDKMDKLELQNEFKIRSQFKGLSKWDRDELIHYLKYKNRSIHDFGRFHSVENYHNQEKEEKHYKQLFSQTPQLTKDEFDKIPLFKLQDYFRFNRSETSKNKIYKQYCQEHQRKAEEKAKDDEFFGPIINHFFQNGDLSKPKKYLTSSNSSNSNDNSGNESKFVLYHDLASWDRSKIHRFAEENGLVTVSMGQDDEHFKKVIGVGRESDRSELWSYVSKESRKLSQKRQNKLDAGWEEIVKKNNDIKTKLIENNSNINDNKGTIKNWKIDGDWEMREYFGYRDRTACFFGGSSKAYLKLFKRRNMKKEKHIHGSFKIEGIEGSIKIKNIGNIINEKNRKFTISWRARDSGTSEIILGKKTGTIEFDDYGTKLKCCMISDAFGSDEFSALRVTHNDCDEHEDESNEPASFENEYYSDCDDSNSDLEDEQEALMHAMENENRWR